MAKKEYFPPLWTTYSRCQEHHFASQLVTHLIIGLVLVFTTESLQALTRRFAPAYAQPHGAILWSLVIAYAAVWLFLLLPTVICTRLWISEEGIAWRSIKGRGVLPWDEVKEWREERYSILLPLIVKEGVLHLPPNYLWDLPKARASLASRGVVNIVPFPMKASPRSGIFSDGEIFAWCMFFRAAADHFVTPPATWIELSLRLFSFVVGFPLLCFLTWQRLHRIHIFEDRVVTSSPLPKLSWTLRLDQLTSIWEPSEEGSWAQFLCLWGPDETGKKRQVQIPLETPNLERLLNHLSAARPDLVRTPESKQSEEVTQ